MTSYISNDQVNLDFSVHDPFKCSFKSFGFWLTSDVIIIHHLEKNILKVIPSVLLCVAIVIDVVWISLFSYIIQTCLNLLIWTYDELRHVPIKN